jgi:hypothetical protein
MKTVNYAVVLFLVSSTAAFAGNGDGDAGTVAGDWLRDLLAPYLRPVELPRFALVLGIEKYDHLQPLTNAVNDMNAVGDALARLGFTVDRAQDLNKQAFQTRIEEFAGRSAGQPKPQKAVVLFYFAGHGFRSGHGNYLVPADAENDARKLVDDSILLSSVMERLAKDSVALALVFIDACRTELTSSTTSSYTVGFGEPQPSGTQSVYYGFASSLGRPSYSFVNPGGTLSPFSSALASHLLDTDTVDQELHDLFESIRSDVISATRGHPIPQIPYELDLTGEYYVSLSGRLVTDLEMKLTFALAKGTACVQKYVDRYPAGPFTTGARSWLMEHGKSEVRGPYSCPD